MKTSVAIIGAGPAGLTAGYALSKKKIPCVIFEADPIYLGGISRTVSYRGFLFDIGPHRFFSKSAEIEALWDEILPGDMLPQARLTRIYYGGKFFNYPLDPWEAFRKLGLAESARCAASFFKAKITRQTPDRSFEHWVSAQFGQRLFDIFFRTYTEKVWGVPTKSISADWASQRIQGMSLLSTLVKRALKIRSRAKPKTLIESFRYPRCGPGQLWNACATKIQALGGQIEQGAKVTHCHFDDGKKQWEIETIHSTTGQVTQFCAEHLISTAPIREFIATMSPNPSLATSESAAALQYRDFITVNLIVKNRNRFSDHWIYIHDPGVKVARLSNFSAWSPDMSPDKNFNAYGMEYFCFDHDGTWKMTDAELVAMASRELVQIGLADEGDVIDGNVARQRQAYPVYDHTYRQNVEQIREEMERRFPTLHFCGRNGMHKYNNQDHSMMTALVSARNIIAGERLFDPWWVNGDAEYIEAGPARAEAETEVSRGLRLFPQTVPT